jgi:hypothetical protein
VRPNLDCLREHLQPAQIEVAGKQLYQTPVSMSDDFRPPFR